MIREQIRALPLVGPAPYLKEIVVKLFAYQRIRSVLEHLS